MQGFNDVSGLHACLGGQGRECKSGCPTTRLPSHAGFELVNSTSGSYFHMAVKGIIKNFSQSNHVLREGIAK